MSDKAIYACRQGHCIIVEDHPATDAQNVAVHYVRQRQDGSWYVWNAGALPREALTPTAFVMPG